MNESDKKFKLIKQKPPFNRIEHIHPYKILTYVMILASSLVFTFYILSFLNLLQFDISKVPPTHFPKLFSVSTILIIASLALSTKLLNDYVYDNIKFIRIRLSMILIIGLLFIILQSLAWLEILNIKVGQDAETAQNYLYLFSGLHLTHVIGGVILAAFLFYRIASVEGDPVKSIILLTNPFEKLLLEIFTAFWHYVVLLWVVIYLILLLV
jgi:cytochrome c oxidase subunit 3